MSNVLVFAEHQDNKFPKSTLVAVGAGKELAAKTGGACYAAVLGSGIDDLAAEIAECGVAKVIAVDDAQLENYLADSYSQVLSQLAKDQGCDVVLATATALGKDLLPRLAIRLEAGIASDVVTFNDDGTMVRPMYAGNADATVSIETPNKVISVRSTAFDPAAKEGKADIEKVSPALDAAGLKMKFVSFNATKSDRPVLTEAAVIVSGGRGLKSEENFKNLIDPLADLLGGAVGATRAAVDAGMVPNDLQIGQTGKVVAPDLYFAIGMSGAIQHVAGMKDSKVIVAVNKDEEAPIFQVADYGLIADLFKVMPELTDEIKKVKQQ